LGDGCGEGGGRRWPSPCGWACPLRGLDLGPATDGVVAMGDEPKAVTFSPPGFLARLSPPDAAALVGLGRLRRYPARSVVFFEGDDAHEVLLIHLGQVKVTVSSIHGREVVLDVLGPGELLGELSAIDGAPRSAGAVALGAVELVAIDVARFNQFVDEHHAVAVALLRSVAGRLRHTTRRQVEFGTVDALGRVCGRIVAMMDRYGHPEGGRVELDAPLSQTEMGGWAGLSREAVVKALAALRALDWIATTGRTITVIEPEALRARAGDSLS
jgi:CRP/FNR family cyclic AMP-dependent transcriptional regulator